MENSGRKLYTEKLSFIHPLFSIEKSNRYTLLFEFHSSELTYCIVEQDTNLLLLFKEIRALQFSKNGAAEWVSHYFSQEELFSTRNWKKICLNIASDKITLVPTAFYTENKKEEFLNFNHIVDLNENKVLVDHLRSVDSYLLYAVNSKLNKVFDQFFPGNKIMCSGTVFLNSVFTEIPSLTNSVAINIRESFFELLIFNNGLKFYNIFPYQGVDDFLYFLLAGCEQNKVNPSFSELFIVGNCDVQSDLINSIRNYFEKISFGISEKTVTREKIMTEVPSHFYFTLFTRLNCE